MHSNKNVGRRLGVSIYALFASTEGLSRTAWKVKKFVRLRYCRHRHELPSFRAIVVQHRWPWGETETGRRALHSSICLEKKWRSSCCSRTGADDSLKEAERTVSPTKHKFIREKRSETIFDAAGCAEFQVCG